VTGRVARLAARVDALAATVVELSARVETLELVVRPPTRPDSVYPVNTDRGGAS
jgi:hypothetical protein